MWVSQKYLLFPESPLDIGFHLELGEVREEPNTVIIAVASATVMSQGSLITVCSSELEWGAGGVFCVPDKKPKGFTGVCQRSGRDGLFRGQSITMRQIDGAGGPSVPVHKSPGSIRAISAMVPVPAFGAGSWR